MGVPRAHGRRRAKRSLGQNFLVDPNLQRKIVEAVGGGDEDEVMEVGPGRGALTRHLVGTVAHLVAIELDNELAAALAERYRDRADVTVINADILAVNPGDHVRDPGRLKVVGNIPYNITTPILFHLLERPRPREIVVMVQEEVADRIVAPVGSSAYGALAVGVRSVALAERLFRVGRRAFRPVPGVDSAVVRIRPLAPPRLSEAEEGRLRTLVRAAFQWRRKQMGKILRDHPDLGLPPDRLRAAAEAAGVSVGDRPERLSPEAFIALSRHLGS
ncbi:MAG: 16S rRNA (adenine(1518)-N(6)/adenine(1519)-N(6))-dimethyltransferase RsmA [Gemmatimonadetes bacterium]|nr:16S rRNA (adenine(1518)-N(6)/adenine(1519)-N(6))-dimethyltransferase RsmA [Gemmatimonadota bacterium]